MTHEPEKAPPLADNDTATMSGKVYNQFRAAWEQRNELLELLTEALPYIEEGEQFNKATARTLSKRVRAIVEA